MKPRTILIAVAVVLLAVVAVVLAVTPKGGGAGGSGPVTGRPTMYDFYTDS